MRKVLNLVVSFCVRLNLLKIKILNVNYCRWPSWH